MTSLLDPDAVEAMLNSVGVAIGPVPIMNTPRELEAND